MASHAREVASVLPTHQRARMSSGRPARFIATARGPVNPPPLRLRVEYRPESSPHPWFALWADGSVAAMCSTMSAAQEALGGLERTEVK
jgi:hypothetical protein